MAEKKTATKKVATANETKAEKAPAKKEAVKKAPAKKAPAKKTSAVESYLNSSAAGFRAGDVYQALAASGKAMSVEEIVKAAKISKEEALIGIGWLFKEGKIVGENVADIRLA